MTTTVLMLRSALSPVRACTFAALLAILSQFTLAGLALFVSASLWSAHIAVGFFVAVLLTALLVLTHRRSGQADLARPARWLATSYVAQVLLAAAADGPGLSALRALHVGNAALLLAAAWHLALRVLNPRSAR